MAYRYTNTDKWSDCWFSKLKPIEKLLFNYLTDNCDIAGFIELNQKRWASDIVTDKGLKAKQWDNKPIDMIYFSELFRISKNQIIWGGNYYPLPANKHCIIWDKIQPEDLSFGMFDYAWTSFDGANKLFRYSVQKEQNKIHPTQKPEQLYAWIFKNYASEGMKIIDTHCGSGSSRIAAHKAGLEFDAFEIDREYFDDSVKRFENYKLQLRIDF